jgi:hypothetical protein
MTPSSRIMRQDTCFAADAWAEAPTVEMAEMIDHFATVDGVAPAAIEKGVNIAKVCDRINQLYQDSTGHRLPWAGEIQLAVIVKDAIDDALEAAAAIDLLAACERALQFITNGIEMGYITPVDDIDPASKTPEILRAAIAKATR